MNSGRSKDRIMRRKFVGLRVPFSLIGRRTSLGISIVTGVKMLTAIYDSNNWICIIMENMDSW